MKYVTARGLSGVDQRLAPRSKKIRLGAVFGVASLLGVAACGGNAGTANDGETGSGDNGGSGGAGPAAFMAESCGGSEDDWSTLIAAAQEEGTVATSGPPDPVTREELPRAFSERFDIDVLYQGGRSSELVAKLESERSASVYSLDTFIGGANTMYTAIHANGWLDNLKDAFVSPDLLEGDTYINGEVPFRDPEGEAIFALAVTVNPPLLLNTDLVEEGEVTGWGDLLDPKWKGLIVADDPTQPGGHGVNVGVQLVLEMGEDFFRDLYAGQEVTLSTDVRQAGDGIAQGKWAIGIAIDPNLVKLDEMIADGLPVKESHTDDLESNTSSGYGLMGLMKDAPHPNAAKLFVNWLACPEGNEVWSRSQMYTPLRSDVEIDLPEYSAFDPDEEYWDLYRWDLITGPEHREAREFIASVLKD